MATVNDMTMMQASTILNDIVQQVTGVKAIAPTNTGEFVSVANTLLKTGVDPVLNVLSQMVSRTVFSTRPYTRKFKGLEASSITYGNHVRKVNYGDSDWINDDKINLTDGKSLDMQEVHKPKVVQTNFYGQNVYSRAYTIFADQLNVALRGPEEFAQFTSGVVSNASDQIEQAHESLARATIANMIGGIVSEGSTIRVLHLLTEYNAATGLTLTSTTVRQPENYPAFIQWLYGRISAVCAMMTERTSLYHTNLTDLTINRHTPYNDQRIFLYADERYSMESRVIADIYHDNYLKMAVTETVNFWQDAQSRDTINVKPTYMKADGTLTTPTDSVSVNNIFGIIADRESMGYTTVNESFDVAPFNARGRYTNTWMHFTDRYWNDFTENAIVLLLD